MTRSLSRAAACAALATSCSWTLRPRPDGSADRLHARAVLPAATFAPGPTSGRRLGGAPVNGVPVPFVDRQPVQGFSAVLSLGDGSFLAMSDNGFGSLENSADHHLRVYRVRPDFETARGGSGTIAVLGHFELRDPDRHVPWAITQHFTAERVLTGADFDIESMQRAVDGTLWFGDEFGPFLVHTDATGKLLEPPVPLPDLDHPGQEIRSPQSPLHEEASAVRIMNAVADHARRHGGLPTPVFSPWHVMLDDGNAATLIDNRAVPPPASGLGPAASDIFSVASLRAAGYPVVTWTVNDKARMLELMRLGVDGIISDRPDLLRQAVGEFDANGDGRPGDLLDAAGLVDITRFDAQGHRGGRDLRPENTLPAMEVALDHLMSTLELDTGITGDVVPVLDHDAYMESAKCRRADGAPYAQNDEVLVKDLTLAQIQSTFICDKVFRGPHQRNDPSLSPVAQAFAAARALGHAYVMPSLAQVFDFVDFYRDYYRSGSGAAHPDAVRRAGNAARVRFNIETKLNPRTDLDDHGRRFIDRTVGPDAFATAVAALIAERGLQARADVQSFDFRSLLAVHRGWPGIRTVFLFGDFPKLADPSLPGSDDGTNLQPQGGDNTPWMAGLHWPYRVTRRDQPFRAQRSGGFEGMALTTDGRRLMPLLEKPLLGGEPRTLLAHVFDLEAGRYSGERYLYRLDSRGTAIGDFILFAPTRGLVIERDDTQGDLSGFKAVYEVGLARAGQPVHKRLAVDLMRIHDPHRISEPSPPGDVGLGADFAFPFVTIEDVVVFDRRHIGVINDNNFPFSVGRHAGTGRPDDTEFIVIALDRPMGTLPSTSAPP